MRIEKNYRMKKKGNKNGIIRIVFLAGMILLAGCGFSSVEEPGMNADEHASLVQLIAESNAKASEEGSGQENFIAPLASEAGVYDIKDELIAKKEMLDELAASDVAAGENDLSGKDDGSLEVSAEESQPSGQQPDETIVPTQTPAPSKTPNQTTVPDKTATPIQTPAPVQTPAPTQTLQPEQTQAPAQTPVPTQTPTPEQTQAPETTPTPTQTQGPAEKTAKEICAEHPCAYPFHLRCAPLHEESSRRR